MDMYRVIEEYYDADPGCEWQRLDRHKIEYAVTCRYLDRYIKSGSKVLDIGGGPGRYSIYLAARGNDVTLFDISSKSIEYAIEKMKESGVCLKGLIHGNALELCSYVKGMHDAVLCMGPLYHLVREFDRHKVIDNCIKVLRPGGILIVSFISVFAPIIDMLKNRPEEILNSKDRYLEYFKDGTNVVSEKNPGFTLSWFEDPGKIRQFMETLRLETIVVAAVEGLFSLRENVINDLDGEQFSAYIDLAMELAENPMTWGSCEHMLYIGRKT